MTTTPLRRLGSADDNGVTRLASGVDGTVDAATRRLRKLISSAPGLASWSTDLVAKATPTELLHVDPARANLLRALAIDAGATVLELGAGAGALTRYLGETAATVDALEPSVAYAQIAAERTADLAAVRVFAATLSDVPVAPTYDLVVAIDSQLDASAVAAATALLAPGGTLLLAEANKLGVKYLAGSPDDTTGVPFDSIEGYPRGGSDRVARSRSELEALLAGYTTHVLPVAPDHTVTRAVLDPERLTGRYASLLSNLPLSPSPDRNGARPRLADEALVWKTLVEEGLAGEFANSFAVLVTASRASSLWPDNRLAVYHSWDRDAAFTTRTTIERAGDVVTMNRVYPHANAALEPRVHDSVTPFVEGAPLAAAMVGASEAQLELWFTAWRALLGSTSRDGRIWLDLHPGNLVLAADGNLVPIDLEFESADHDVDFAMRRGLLIAARLMGLTTHPSRWPTSFSTLRDIALFYGRMAGYQSDAGWLDATIADEAAFQRVIAGSRSAETVGDRTAALETMLDTPLTALPLGERDFGAVEQRNAAFERLGVFDERIRGLEDHERILQQTVATQHERILDTDAKLAVLDTHAHSLESRLAEAKAQAYEMERALRDDIHGRHLAMQELQGSPLVRSALRWRGRFARIAPAGSRRRRLLGKLAGR